MAEHLLSQLGDDELALLIARERRIAELRSAAAVVQPGEHRDGLLRRLADEVTSGSAAGYYLRLADLHAGSAHGRHLELIAHLLRSRLA